MIHILAEFTVAEENIEICKNLFTQLQNESNKEEGCLHYSMYQVSRQENVFIINETFTNQEGFDYHKTTSHYNNILKAQIEPHIIDKRVRFLI